MAASRITLYLIVCVATSVLAGDTDPGEYCTQDQDCQLTASCVGEKCVCKPNFSLNTRTNTCVGGVGQQCEYDENCIVNAFCFQRSKCTCKDGLKPSDDGMTCEGNIRNRIADTTCTSDQECTRYYAKCNQKSGECECDYRTQHYVGGRCWDIKGLDQRCTDTNECYTENHPNRIECNQLNKTCTCKEPYVANSDKTYCDAGMIVQVTSTAVLMGTLLITRFISI